MKDDPPYIIVGAINKLIEARASCMRELGLKKPKGSTIMKIALKETGDWLVVEGKWSGVPQEQGEFEQLTFADVSELEEEENESIY